MKNNNIFVIVILYYIILYKNKDFCGIYISIVHGEKIFILSLREHLTL